MGIRPNLAVLLKINVNCDTSSVCVLLDSLCTGEMMQGVNCYLVRTEQ
jgi:hypothetical protein